MSRRRIPHEADDAPLGDGIELSGAAHDGGAGGGGRAAGAPAADGQMAPCVPFLQICCIDFAFYPIHTANLQAINAMGRSDVFLRLELIKKSYGLLILAATVFLFDSVYAIAWGAVASTLLAAVVNASPNRKLLGYGYLEQMRDVLPALALSAVMFAAVWALGQLPLSPLSPLPLLVLQVLAGAAIYGGLALLLRLESMRYLMDSCAGWRPGGAGRRRLENSAADGCGLGLGRHGHRAAARVGFARGGLRHLPQGMERCLRRGGRLFSRRSTPRMRTPMCARWRKPWRARARGLSHPPDGRGSGRAMCPQGALFGSGMRALRARRALRPLCRDKQAMAALLAREGACGSFPRVPPTAGSRRQRTIP